MDKSLDKPAHAAVHVLAPLLGRLDESGAQSAPCDPLPNATRSATRSATSAATSAATWAGYVVPKRHARRAVTRNLIRRQMRQILLEQQGAAEGLAPGIWVLRLRQGFDTGRFPSAASEPLKQAVREELSQLLGHALRRQAQQGARP